MIIIQKIIEWWNTYVQQNGYNFFEMFLFMSGFALWVVAYIHIIKNTYKYGFNEMPMLVATGNWAWEFIWSFLFKGDLGNPFMWGCRMWFFLDIVINYTSYRYGKNKVPSPAPSNLHKPLYIFSYIAWFAIVYAMGREGDDNQLGVLSALVINVAMSALYVYQLFAAPERRGKGISYHVAWYKMVGTGVISLAGAIHWFGNRYLIALGVISFILDAWYIYLFKTFKPLNQSESYD